MGDEKFIVLAAFHSGLLKHTPSFRKALDEPTLNIMYGCAQPSQRYSQGKMIEYPSLLVVVRGVEYQFYRHPELFLIPEVQVKIAEMNYNNDNDIKASFDMINAKDEELFSFYKDALNACLKLKEVMDG